MSALPLFIPDRSTLLTKLRLSPTIDGAAAAMVDSAINEVRVGIYDALGSSQVTTILATAHDDAATSDAALNRLRAENVELLWIRALLYQTMPVLLLDTEGSSRQAWNEEGITRKAGDSFVSKAVQRLMSSVNAGLDVLAGGDGGTLDAYVPVPDETPQRPGASIDPLTNRVASI